jgi:hypothetical protein
MALTDRNILITPNTSASNEPIIAFTGGSASTSATTYLRVLDNGTVSNEGTSGQLHSIIDSLSGSIYSVTDKSGIPSLEILDSGQVNIARYQGNVFLGSNTVSSGTGTGALVVLGGLGVSGAVNFGGALASGAATITGASTISGNLGVGGASANYGLTVNTTTNLAALFQLSGTNGIAIQTGSTPGIGFNSYNNGTQYVLANGYNAFMGMSGANFVVNVSSASQSSAALATQFQALSISSTGILVPISTTFSGSSTGTSAIVTYGSVSAATGVVTGADSYFNSVRVGLGNSNVTSNLVLGPSAGGSLGGSSARNYLIGQSAGSSITTGGDNVIISNMAGTTGLSNSVIIGTNTSGGSTSAILGNLAGQSATAGGQVLIGYAAGRLAAGGTNNIAVGQTAMQNATGGNNIAIGSGAGSGITSGTGNVVLGNYAGANNTNYIWIADGAGNLRISSDGSGNITVSSTTAANGTGGIGSLIVSGGASIASGLTLGGALYASGSAGTSGYFLKTSGSGISWAQSTIAISNDAATNSTRYPLFTDAVSGNIATEYVDSTHLTYVPATGVLATTGYFSGPHNGTVGATTKNTGDFTAITANNGLTVSAGATSLQGTTVQTTLQVNGIGTFSQGDDATSGSTGALRVTGGIGATKQIYSNSFVIGNVLQSATPFIQNATNVTADITLPATYNTLSSGDITINNGVTVTIALNGVWTVI